MEMYKSRSARRRARIARTAILKSQRMSGELATFLADAWSKPREGECGTAGDNVRECADAGECALQSKQRESEKVGAAMDERSYASPAIETDCSKDILDAVLEALDDSAVVEEFCSTITASYGDATSQREMRDSDMVSHVEEVDELPIGWWESRECMQTYVLGDDVEDSVAELALRLPDYLDSIDDTLTTSEFGYAHDLAGSVWGRVSELQRQEWLSAAPVAQTALSRIHALLW